MNERLLYSEVFLKWPDLWTRSFTADGYCVRYWRCTEWASFLHLARDAFSWSVCRRSMVQKARSALTIGAASQGT